MYVHGVSYLLIPIWDIDVFGGLIVRRISTADVLVYSIMFVEEKHRKEEKRHDSCRNRAGG